MKNKAMNQISPLLHMDHIKILQYIMNNSGIDALKISKKTKIPQASVYRGLMDLLSNDNNFLTTMTKKPGLRGANATIMYSANSKQYHIIINKKGVTTGLK